MMRNGDIVGNLQHAKVGPRQNLSADGGVGFHDFKLFGGQLAGFQQDRIGDADFADIVHGGGQAQILNFVCLPADGFRHDGAGQCDAANMTAGFLIPGFKCGQEPVDGFFLSFTNYTGLFLYDLLQSLTILFECPFKPNRSLADSDAGLKLIRVKGFYKVIINAFLGQGRDNIILIAPGSQKDNVNIGFVTAMLADMANQFKSVHFGHVPVGQNDVDIFGKKFFKSLQPVFGRDDMVVPFF